MVNFWHASGELLVYVDLCIQAVHDEILTIRVCNSSQKFRTTVEQSVQWSFRSCVQLPELNCEVFVNEVSSLYSRRIRLIF